MSHSAYQIGMGILCLLLLTTISCTKDKLSNPTDKILTEAITTIAPNSTIDDFILPYSSDLDNLPQDPNNKLTATKVNLGKMLFFETGLALDALHELGEGTYSCATCHVPSAGFMPGAQQGIGDGGLGFGNKGETRTKLFNYTEEEIDVQGARPLSLINVAFTKNTSWNGQFGGNHNNIGTEYLWSEETLTEVNHLGFAGIESQNIEGLHLHRMVVNKPLMDEYGYTPWFNAAFPDVPYEERYNEVTAALAISAYIRSLVPNQAPFQRWLKGDRAGMTESQKLGAVLFFDKAKCYLCHNNTALNNADNFYAIGVKDLHEAGAFNTTENDRRNLGRGGFTQKEEDLYKFKVPQLYNLKDGGFYFHGSSKNSLREVVEYFNKGESENANIPNNATSNLFNPLNLTTEEIDHLVEFLENGLFDPNMNRYVPDEVLSGNCFPNNDPISQIQLGCD